jgi:uncharacterized protein YqgC (DUF456 family)
MTEILLWIAGGSLVLAGLAGLVLPALPGTLLVFAGLLAAAGADGFTRVGWVTVALLAVLLLLSYIVEFLASAVGAKRFGAGRAGRLGAVLGGVVGLFFGVAGVLFGPLAGAFLGELLFGRDPRRAGKAGVGAWLGYVLGIASKVALAFLMIALFVAAYFL